MFKMIRCYALYARYALAPLSTVAFGLGTDSLYMN